jgi:hypothetical protein
MVKEAHTVQAVTFNIFSACYLYRLRSAHNWFSSPTNRKVASSIPYVFIGYNPSGRTMVLGLTQPLTELSIRSISLWVKAADA